MFMLKLRLDPKARKNIYLRTLYPVRKVHFLFSLHAEHFLYSKHEEKLGGVFDILSGLEYHNKKIRNFEKVIYRKVSKTRLQSKEKLSFEQALFLTKYNQHPVVHESVAYIGRLGQLCYFFESKWFAGEVGKMNIASEIPAILALSPLRQKHTAHRQQDWPRSDDCSLGFNQHGLMPSMRANHELQCINIEFQFPTKPRHPLL